jgi:hypothetical protein
VNPVAITTPGEVFTFQVLFLDGMGDPIAPPDPTIEVFTFNTEGAKVVLVTPGTAMAPVVGDTGRYVYIYAVPTTWTYQPTMYGVMRGTDPLVATVIVVEMEVDVIQSTASLTIRNNGIVVSNDVTSLNITGSGAVVTSATPGRVDVAVAQVPGRGLIAQFVRGG